MFPVVNKSKLLKALNVNMVLIGIESADTEVLKELGKGDNASPEDNLRAVKLLFENKIDIGASYILGLPGETDETCKKNMEQIEQFYELAMKYLGHAPRNIYANQLEVTHKSRIYNDLVNKMPEKYASKGRVCLNTIELTDDYFRTQFNLNENELKNYKKKLTRYSDAMITFSSEKTDWRVSYSNIPPLQKE